MLGEIAELPVDVNGVYPCVMHYHVGSPIRVRLYSGQIVDANITAIVSRSAGRKIHIAYGNVNTTVNPAQIIEVGQPEPKESTGRKTTSQIVREIADDYRRLATEVHGRSDALRDSNHRWLLKLADKIAAKRTAHS